MYVLKSFFLYTQGDAAYDSRMLFLHGEENRQPLIRLFLTFLCSLQMDYVKAIVIA